MPSILGLYVYMDRRLRIATCTHHQHLLLGITASIYCRCRRLLRHMAITQRLLTTRASQALLHPVTTSFNILFPMNYPEPVQVTVKATSTPTCLPDPYASSTLTASQQAKL
jgi:hypothetical protein